MPDAHTVPDGPAYPPEDQLLELPDGTIVVAEELLVRIDPDVSVGGLASRDLASRDLDSRDLDSRHLDTRDLDSRHLAVFSNIRTIASTYQAQILGSWTLSDAPSPPWMFQLRLPGASLDSLRNNATRIAAEPGVTSAHLHRRPAASPGDPDPSPGDPDLTPDPAPDPGDPTTQPSGQRISAGYEHTCAVDVERQLWCWGDNRWGQIGDGGLHVNWTPERITGLPPVVDVDAGREHTCAVADSGRLWCWGKDERGQLGDGTMSLRLAPREVSLPAGASAAARVRAGHEHSCALDADDRVYCWGGNDHGELGTGSFSPSSRPLAVAGDLPRADMITTGRDHSCAMDEVTLGAVCWGEGGEGQLGNGSLARQNRPTPVAAGPPWLATPPVDPPDDPVEDPDDPVDDTEPWSGLPDGCNTEETYLALWQAADDPNLPLSAFSLDCRLSQIPAGYVEDDRFDPNSIHYGIGPPIRWVNGVPESHEFDADHPAM